MADQFQEKGLGSVSSLQDLTLPEDEGYRRFVAKETAREKIIRSREKPEVFDEHGPEWRTVGEWHDAFTAYVNGDGKSDEETKLTVKRFLNERHDDMTIHEVFAEREKFEEGGASVGSLGKEFVNWMTFKEPWKIFEMREVAEEILFDEKNQKSPQFGKFLKERFKVDEFDAMQKQMSQHELGNDYVVSEYLKWLSARGSTNLDKETLRSMALVAGKRKSTGVKEPIAKEEEAGEPSEPVSALPITLFFDRRSLDRLTNDGDEKRMSKENKRVRKNTQMLVDNWGMPGGIKEIRIGVDKMKISAILFRTESVMFPIPANIFRTVLLGAYPCTDFDAKEQKPDGTVVGIKFGNRPTSPYIYPRTPRHILEKIFHRVRIDNKALASAPKIFKIPYVYKEWE